MLSDENRKWIRGRVKPNRTRSARILLDADMSRPALNPPVKKPPLQGWLVPSGGSCEGGTPSLEITKTGKRQPIYFFKGVSFA